MLTVLCCKWFDENYRHNSLYTLDAEWVNKLKWSVRRNLDMPHRFVCFTDNEDGIDADVEVFPIWDDWAEVGLCYRRLRLFSDDEMIRECCGPRFCSIDLDVVVTGNLTPLLSRTEPLVIYNNIVYKHQPYCCAIWMQDTGAFPEVWTSFSPETLANIDTSAPLWNGSDQAWLSLQIGPYHPTWSQADGIYHYKKDVHQQGLPADARIVLFNGAVAPCMPELQERHPWILENWRCGA